ncbi:MAG TPA: hypothetical protein VK633_11775, partial [Verrucomicrobiae bacterium]|nr:hypothetical protein [Verrucomicrobiae bacterium]
TLTVTTVTNAFGTSTITLVADDGAKASTNSFVLTVTSVNDVPSFALATNLITVAEDSGVYSLPNFVTSISAGPANESTQTNNFVLTTTNSAFFATQPTITSAGTLSFKTATNVFGTNDITVVIHDSGGTNSNGVNVSAAQLFTVIVTAVNDTPVISGISAYTINEDAGATNRAFAVSDVDTTIGSVTVDAASSDTNLVTVSVTGTTTNRTLVVTTVTNAFGTATITLIADDGAASATNSFLVTVASVNDAPSFTLASNNVIVTKYTTVMTVTNFGTNIISGPSNESTQTWSFVVTPGNASSFVVQPSMSTNGTLTFQAKDIAGAASVTVKLQDNGGVANGGTNLSAAQTFTVTVPANPYIPLSGQYNGLFYETNGVVNSSAGFMNFTLATNGTFTGYVLLEGGSNLFNGQFDIAGNVQSTITRTNGDLALNMAIDLSTNFTESARGTVTNNSWSSVLLVDRATFRTGFNPAPYAGEYNLQLPGSITPATLPGGNSYGMVTIGDSGVANLEGMLSDGTAFAQVVSISKEGVWPLYVSLYNGAGCLVSWITIVSDSSSDLSGDATWIREASVGGTYYASGFTNDVTITGSYYEEPPIGIQVLNLNTGSVILSGGNLSASLTNNITLNVDQTVTVDPAATNGLSLTIDIASGTFSGQFVDPTSAATVPVQGVLLQASTNAVGYFLGTSQSGSIILR